MNDLAYLSLRSAAFAMAVVLLAASFAAAVAAPPITPPGLAPTPTVATGEFDRFSDDALWATADVYRNVGSPSIVEIETDGIRLAAFY